MSPPESPSSRIIQARYASWGRALVGQGEYGDAIHKFQKAIALDPVDREAYRNWGLMLAVLMDRHAEFEPVARDRHHARTYDHWGVELKERGNYDGAIEKYEKAIEHNMFFAPAYANWGRALAGGKAYDAAISMYKRALALDANELSAYIGWGAALAERGDYQAAMEKYRHVIAIDPSEVMAYVNWGRALTAQESYSEAIEKYRLAVGVDLYSAAAYDGWSIALARTGVGADAQVMCARAHALDPAGEYECGLTPDFPIAPECIVRP